MNNEKTDLSALFNIGYGLYVVTSNDGKKDNGLILNSIMQLTSSPAKIGVTINKSNYSHDVIKESGKMNINCLTVEAPFKLFEKFGFKSGRDANKFEGMAPRRSANGLAVLNNYVNSYISLEVTDYIDLGSHGMFIAEVTEAKNLSTVETMSYSYYHKNVKPKPKPQPDAPKGYICKICGFIHYDETLPEDFECPICKHGPEDFEPIS